MSDWVIPWIDYLRWEFVLTQAYKPGDEYRWIRHDTAPLTPMTKPLNQCRVSFWSEAQARMKDQEPWESEKGEGLPRAHSYREIPRDVDVNELLYFGSWMDYDAEQDRNLVFPLDRFRELEKEGFIGELAPVVFTSHATFHVKQLMLEMAPKVAERLKELKIDALALFNN